MVAPTNVQSPPARPQRVIDRVGASLRHEINNPLQVILSEAQILIGGGGAQHEITAAAEAIERSARRIASILADFEDLAAREIEGVPAPDAAPSRSPTRLTRALAAELTLIARSAGSPAPRNAALLRPRFRRAARLAQIWLSGSTSALPEPARAPNARAAEPPQRADPLGIEAAAFALASRLERLEAEYRELRQRFERRERYWRFAMHELRNAANAFTSWAYALRTSEIRDAPWFTPLLRAAGAVLRRAEDALDPQAADNTEFRLRSETIDLLDVARQAVDAIRPTADLRKLSFTVNAPTNGDPIGARADADRVHQILYNLLRNATEATPPGGSVRLTVRHEKDWAVVEVEDTGPGVPPEIITDLFHVDDMTATPPDARRGFGLGLPLSRNLAEQLGGSLVLESSEAGAGARFVLRLPRV